MGMKFHKNTFQKRLPKRLRKRGELFETNGGFEAYLTRQMARLSIADDLKFTPCDHAGQHCVPSTPMPNVTWRRQS